MVSTGAPAAIGKERFDRTFFADLDSGSIQMIIGAADPTATRVYWAYKSVSGTTGQFDKVLCYDYALDRASIIAMRGEYLASLARPGLTLENLDSISASIELSVPSTICRTMGSRSAGCPKRWTGMIARVRGVRAPDKCAGSMV